MVFGPQDDVLSAKTLIKAVSPPLPKVLNVPKPPIKVRKVPRPAPMVIKLQNPLPTLPKKPLLSASAAAQKIVVLQKPGGTMQQIRIANNQPASNNGQSVIGAGTSTTSNVQLIKTSDGSFIQINGKQGSPSTGALTQSTTSTSNPSGSTGNGGSTQYIIKSGGSQKMVFANTPTIKLPPGAVKLNPSPSSSSNVLASNSKTVMPGIPTGTPRTLTVAQAQKMGLLSAAKLKELVSQATAQKQAKAAAAAALNDPSLNSSSNNSSTVRQIPVHVINTANITPVTETAPVVTVQQTNKPRVMQGNQKILIQTAEGVQKQVVLPPHLYKLAQEGKIKAVSIAGKGIQYVRVNTPNTNKVAVSNAPNISGVKNNWSVVKLPVRPTTMPPTDGSRSDHTTRTLLPMAGTSKHEGPPKKVSWIYILLFKKMFI